MFSRRIPAADATVGDHLVEATDNVGPDDYPDPVQDPNVVILTEVDD